MVNLSKEKSRLLAIGALGSIEFTFERCDSLLEFIQSGEYICFPGPAGEQIRVTRTAAFDSQGHLIEESRLGRGPHYKTMTIQRSLYLEDCSIICNLSSCLYPYTTEKQKVVIRW